MSTEKLELEGVLTTYKFYTRKGERLAIFAREQTNLDESKELEISIIKCSKEDEFEKQKAKLAFLLGVMVEEGEFKLNSKITVEFTKIEDVHPEMFYVPIQEGNSAKYTFVKFCNENFYKVKREKVEAIKLTFVGGGKSKLLGFEPLNN